MRAGERPGDRYRDPSMPWRPVLAIGSAALVAGLGALILGEYEFEGSLPFLAGPLFGLVVGEVLVSIARSRALWLGLVGGAVAAAGVAWAGWIDSSQGVEPVKALVWVAAALAAVAALVRTTGLRRR